MEIPFDGNTSKRRLRLPVALHDGRFRRVSVPGAIIDRHSKTPV